MSQYVLRHPELPDQPIVVDDPSPWLPSGWQVDADGDPAAPNGPAVDSLLPKGNASTEDWSLYALGHGFTPAQLEGLGRDAIRDLVGNGPDTIEKEN